MYSHMGESFLNRLEAQKRRHIQYSWYVPPLSSVAQAVITNPSQPSSA